MGLTNTLYLVSRALSLVLSYPIGCHKPPFRTSPHITPVIVTVPVGNPKTPLTLHS
jgi:hypothetical protein